MAASGSGGGSGGEGSLLAMIVDQDTATGMLLTGVGQVDLRKRTNFLIVDESEHSTSCSGWGWAAAGGSVVVPVFWVLTRRPHPALMLPQRRRSSG